MKDRAKIFERIILVIYTMQIFLDIKAMLLEAIFTATCNAIPNEVVQFRHRSDVI